MLDSFKRIALSWCGSPFLQVRKRFLLHCQCTPHLCTFPALYITVYSKPILNNCHVCNPQVKSSCDTVAALASTAAHPDLDVSIASVQEAFDAPILADRVVIAHPGFKAWMAGRCRLVYGTWELAPRHVHSYHHKNVDENILTQC